MNSERHPAQSSGASLGLLIVTGVIFLDVWKASSHTANKHNVFAAPAKESKNESTKARSLNKKPEELFYPKPASPRQWHSPATYPFPAPLVLSSSVPVHHPQALPCNTISKPCVIPLIDLMAQYQGLYLSQAVSVSLCIYSSCRSYTHFSFCLAWSPILTLSTVSYTTFHKSPKSQF